ncbi:MAG: endonuclease III [Candidatus ainarchaeum sp.]|nr:endonuclease III [Candidatus ainarchaeum sp.]MDD3975808.1 endonuclease III [Candidatus ainarchaeum sp.]
MNSKDIYEVYEILEESLKDYTIPLAEQIQVKTKKPFFVLIGTILSARTKDETTAKVCNKLFKKIKNFKDLEKIEIKKLEKLLYPVGFYKQKAEFLKKLPEVINNEFNEQIPSEIEDLIKLPGVGRKTANLVRSVAFNLPGICVDTHVHRIFNRIEFIKTENPLETEMVLRKKIPEDLWNKTNYLFVMLGQNICKPISPICRNCKINKFCNFKNKTK